MSYKLLVKKLELEEKKNKFITRAVLKSYCETLKMNYYSAIRYLLSNKCLVRILRGIFYIKSIEEKKSDKIDINYLKAIKEALRIKGIKNWYFGMETALKLNALTHEYFIIDYVISDSLYRPKAFGILGHKIKFLKIKKSLINFGVKKDKLNYSDTEKTILDIIYFSKYNNFSDNEIKNKVADYFKHCDKTRLLNYSKKYPKSVNKIIESIK